MVASLLEATERVLNEVGVRKVTTTRIAAMAGVSVGTVYQYFPSKEALIAAWEERVWTALFDELRKLYADLEARGECFERMAYEFALHGALQVGKIAGIFHTMPGEAMFTARAEQKMEMAAQISLFITSVLMTQEQHLRTKDHDLSARILLTMVVNTAFYGQTEQPQYSKSGKWAEEIAEIVCQYLLREPQKALLPRAQNTNAE